MVVSKFGDCMPCAFVDGPRNLSALNMSDTDVHVRGSKGSGESFIAVTDQHNYIGLQALELAGKLDDREPQRFCHRRGRRSFEFDINLAVNEEAVADDILNRMAETF